MKKAAGVLRDNADEYAILMAQEMGKPVKSGRSEAEKCAWVCDYYADHAEKFLQAEIIETEASKSFVTFQFRFGCSPFHQRPCQRGKNRGQ